MEVFYRAENFPRKSVMLTFDDGYLDNWFSGNILINEFNLKAHIFLITVLLEMVPVSSLSWKGIFSSRLRTSNSKPGMLIMFMLRWSEVKRNVCQSWSGRISCSYTYSYTLG
ncbi:polysaccharide deacetylase family protein [Klebsiella pneumoniae]|nr:polysaccharide deacetylase family protein [Klebsiella pneumoniae]